MKESGLFSFDKWYQFQIGLLSFVLLVFPKFTAMAFLGFVPMIAYGVWKKYVSFRVSLIPGLFILLYILYLLYCSFTRYPDIAGKYLEYKLALIVLALLLSFQLKRKVNWSISIRMYLLAIIVLLAQSYYSGISNYYHFHDTKYLFTSFFSYQHHPTYSSVFLILAMCLAVYGYRNNFKYFRLFWIIPFLALLIFSHFLYLSLAGLLFLCALMGCVILHFIYKKWGKLYSIGALLIIPFFFTVIVKQIPKLSGEWSSATQFVNEYVKNPEVFVKKQAFPFNGSVTRLVMWTASYQLLTEYPLGVGTGNVDEVLIKKVIDLEQSELAKYNYNPHNQYLQTGIEIGVFGLLVLLAIVFFSIKKGVQDKNWILIILGFNFAFNMLFESMLQRQEGLVFYVLALCVLYNVNRYHKKENTKKNS